MEMRGGRLVDGRLERAISQKRKTASSVADVSEDKSRFCRLFGYFSNYYVCLVVCSECQHEAFSINPCHYCYHIDGVSDYMCDKCIVQCRRCHLHVCYDHSTECLDDLHHGRSFLCGECIKKQPLVECFICSIKRYQCLFTLCARCGKRCCFNHKLSDYQCLNCCFRCYQCNQICWKAANSSRLFSF